ncbi:uncharacterized protein LOC111328570 [Stylophora pistillata]|uniref:uncharacterized protein LOC111328570 n=1 Tax=Stylophora pistillata TaxID=50429 RepID=UPI000C03E5DB|nr:uncharacterized protein LOC111328570 [Stylophora pistillata]
MASSCDEPPVRRKRKAPDEVITKNVVVLRSSQVCEMDGVVLMPNTTLKMSDIKKNGQSGKLSFTKSTSSTEMERSLQQTFPFLAESNSRIYSAKAVDGKSKLDFCGQRRMWSGEETNRIITGNRALYIYCKEEISKHCPLLPAQVENLQISGTVSSSDNWDSGFETCGISQGNHELQFFKKIL